MKSHEIDAEIKALRDRIDSLQDDYQKALALEADHGRINRAVHRVIERMEKGEHIVSSSIQSAFWWVIEKPGGGVSLVERVRDNDMDAVWRLRESGVVEAGSVTRRLN